MAITSSGGLVRRMLVGFAMIATSCSEVIELPPPPPPVFRVSSEPAFIPSMYVDDQIALTVRLTDANDAPLADRSITYSSSHPADFSVSASGVIRGLRYFAGPGYVTIRSEGKSATVGVGRVRGWQIDQGSPPAGGLATVQISLAAEPEGANGSQGGAASMLRVACLGGTTRSLVLYLRTGGASLRNGAVTYHVDGAEAVTETWIESAPGSSTTLLYPGGAFETTRFAQRLPNSGSIRFQWVTGVGATEAPVFVLRATSAALAPVLAACPLRPGTSSTDRAAAITRHQLGGPPRQAIERPTTPGRLPPRSPTRGR